MAGQLEIRYPSARKGYSIYARFWEPEGMPRGVVQIVHGLTDHVGRYAELAQFLTGHGFLVCGEDHLGHGRTVEDGAYGSFAPRDGWTLALQDVQRLWDLAGGRCPGTPYFLFGHSMGSFLVRALLLRRPGGLAGAVLAGTGQEPLPLVALGRGLARLECWRIGPERASPLPDLLSHWAYNRRFRPNRTRADWVSSDPAAVDAYLADPLCQPRPAAALLRDLMDGLWEISRPGNGKRMDPDLPILFLSGARDPVGGMGRGVRKAARLFQAAGCRDVALKLYPDARHELVHERRRGEVFQDLLAWLEDKLPGRA